MNKFTRALARIAGSVVLSAAALTLGVGAAQASARGPTSTHSAVPADSANSLHTAPQSLPPISVGNCANFAVSLDSIGITNTLEQFSCPSDRATFVQNLAAAAFNAGTASRLVAAIIAPSVE